jgi:hypothetical protein
MTEATILNAVEAAQARFRFYGFKATRPTFTLSQELPNRTRGTLTVRWEEEDATGMAAFTQKKINCSIQIYSEALKEPGEWSFDLLATPFNLEEWGVSMHVEYDHHSGGSNGIRRNHVLVKSPPKKGAKKSDPATFSLRATD